MGSQSLTNDQISQIRLPERLSGLGLLSSLDMSTPAFIGSARQAIYELSQRGVMADIINQTFTDNQQLEIQWHLELRSSWERYREEINHHSGDNRYVEWSNAAFMALQPIKLQHNLFSALMVNKQKTLLNNCSPQDKIRILSCSAIGASAFIRAPAHIQGCMFNNEEYKIAIKMRLNAPLVLLCPSRCICGSLLEDEGDHLFKCRIGSEWSH